MKNLIVATFFFFGFYGISQTLLKPDRVFDGTEMHENWAVLVQGNIIAQVGPEDRMAIPKKTKIIELAGTTLLPGLIEGHSHLLLHPYNETSWNDQVLKESPVERSIRGVVHAKNSLMAGITTMRDLGSEGAGYSDVYLKKSIDAGIVPGPRLLVAGPAIVATGAYGPKGFHDGVTVPLGAEAASGNEVVKTVRRQLGNGADFIKIYADYRWRSGEASNPTFSLQEIQLMNETAKSAGRYIVAHASTPEGMRRAILGGAETIEHGDHGTLEVFQLMKEKGVALCPTLAAGDAVSQYNGWQKGRDPEPDRIVQKRASFKLALQAGVTIAFGGDVGVFSHGDNVRELQMMVDYGMEPLAVLQAATSVNAQVFHQDALGKLEKGFLADIIAVEGNPTMDISKMRAVQFVMKDGRVYKQP
ncbi:amidohydrolase family protein [Spongiimicrobium sp. 2-473A-2-J]|uniref:amidohydrolase family protein n=1 Tax=Eudoraea algarum TaxID=3417568 RepID=UPI003D36CA52